VEAASERNAVLVELETLQNDLIQRLDDLDHRVCEVLKQWSSIRQSESPKTPAIPVGAEAQPGS